ncbi:cytochrome P450 [Sphingomonas desiccabilis]|uniref:Cytochrome P450 n=2 Tax=Sphingomonas desiccabilis TaxID=429134 RepID=A0A4Q2ISV3_9SPHN|nr:cytochrome P450 [Sphingomonas desiccabilis]
MRERGAVIWDPYVHTWIVTGYAEAVTVFQDFLSARTPSPEAFHRMGLPMLAPAAEVMRRQMMFMDPPRHMRVRAACSALFSPVRVRRMEDRMREICRALLEDIPEGSAWDLHAAYAEPLPAMMTTEIAGLPIQDWRQLQIWSDDFAALIGNFHQSTSEGNRLAESLDAMTRYITDVIAEQRGREGSGLIGALLAQGGDDPLDDTEIVANVIITLVGGLGTTTNLISSGVATLVAHPDAMRQMREDPAAMRGAVEEILRFETPSQFSGRIAPAEVVLGGQPIARGDAVMVMTAAANRDSLVFEDPDRFDIRRSPNRHLAFAWGPHFCFGAALARMQGAIAFGELLKRTTTIELTDAPLQWRENLGLRGLTTLPVLTRRAAG